MSPADKAVWDRLIGQEAAVAALQAAALEGQESATNLEASRQALSHAWLFTGPAGSGRSTAARALAAALQCTGWDGDVPGSVPGCGECKACRTVLGGTHPDVSVKTTDKVIFKKDDVRSWVQEAYDSPISGAWRIMIVEDADRMSEEASNVLLKSIEEPADRTIWMLCAPSAADLLPTIQSRCRSLNLRTPPAQVVADYLVDAEGVGEDAALRAATLAQSHVGVARAMLRDPDLREQRKALFTMPLQARSVSGAVVVAHRMEQRATQIAKERTERVNEQERADLLASIGVREGEAVPRQLRGLVRDLEDDQKRRGTRALADALDLALVDLTGFYRDILATQLGAGERVVNVDLVPEIQERAASSSPQEVLAAVDAVALARERLQTNMAVKLVLEALIISLAEPQLAANYIPV